MTFWKFYALKWHTNYTGGDNNNNNKDKSNSSRSSANNNNQDGSGIKTSADCRKEIIHALNLKLLSDLNDFPGDQIRSEKQHIVKIDTEYVY